MDIHYRQTSNALLFELSITGTELRTARCSRFPATGEMRLDARKLRARQAGRVRVDDAETTATIAELYRDTGMIIDPHTAVGMAAARRSRRGSDHPIVVLATAHPAKFGDAVEAAIGVQPPMPPALAVLAERPERCTRLANDLAAVKAHVAQCSGHGVG